MDKVEKVAGGFRIKADTRKLERQARDERIKQRKVNPKSNPTNREVMEAINDNNDLLIEIRELLAKR